jgi:hypothetical protein
MESGVDLDEERGVSSVHSSESSFRQKRLESVVTKPHLKHQKAEGKRPLLRAGCWESWKAMARPVEAAVPHKKEDEAMRRGEADGATTEEEAAEVAGASGDGS